MRPPRVVLLTDRAQLPLGRGLVSCVKECVDAGLTAVVVREHDLAPSARAALLRELAAVPGLCVVSSRVSDPSARGVHVAAVGRPPARGPWGRSCHASEEVRRAAEEGAAWATLSPYAASASKPGYGPALPSGALAGHPIPVLALGGVHPGNAAEALAAGAHGVAVMGAVMRAPDPGRVVARLLEAAR